MFISFNAVWRPDDNIARIREAFREIWTARMLEKRSSMINCNARWSRQWYFVSIDSCNSIDVENDALGPFGGFEESV